MKTLIETQGVTKCYGEEEDCLIHVLKGIDLKVGKGSFTSIMGPSGSGKTTLLDILGALLKPTSGRVFIEGQDLSELSDSELARIRGRMIGFIFQQYNLIPSLTATENVSLSLRLNGKSREESTRRALYLLRMVGLGERVEHRPSQLSGGEQQRVAIARSLANSPKIILADEPTGNLDSNTGFRILELLKRLNKEEGYTIVVVTHDHRIGKYTEKTIYLMDGKIVKEENHG